MIFGKPFFWAVTALVSVSVLGGCSKPNEETKEARETSTSLAVSPAAMTEATTIFNMRCVPCHGSVGKGDGPASKGLTPPPRSFSDSEWQKSISDEHIEKIIKFGGAAVARSPMMPANPDLIAKDEVVRGLKNVVRSFAGK